MEVVDAMDLIRGVDGERKSVEVPAADDACETARVVRLPSRSQHLHHQHQHRIIIMPHQNQI